MAEMAPPKVVMLIANETSPNNLRNADNLRTLFKSKKVAWEEIDGTDPSNKEKRSELFGVSGMRAEYPQVFFEYPDPRQFRFIGNYGMVSALNENAAMLKENPQILVMYPDLVVFDDVFAETQQPQSETCCTKSSPRTDAKNGLVADKDVQKSSYAEASSVQSQLQDQNTCNTSPDAAVEPPTKHQASSRQQAEGEKNAEAQSRSQQAFQEHNAAGPQRQVRFEPSSELTPELTAEMSAENEQSPQGEKKQDIETSQQRQQPSAGKPQRLRNRDKVKGHVKRLVAFFQRSPNEKVGLLRERSDTTSSRHSLFSVFSSSTTTTCELDGVEDRK